MRKEEVIEIARTAAIEAMGYRENFIREEFDKRYQDVKLLMRNYRKLKAYYSRVDAEVLEANVIRSTHCKTGLMMSHVDKMLVAYKALCQEAETPEELRRWQVLYLRYMADKRMKIDDIADSLNPRHGKSNGGYGGSFIRDRGYRHVEAQRFDLRASK